MTTTPGNILVIAQGEPSYEPVMSRLRADRDLLNLMHLQAGFELDEHPDKVWIVAVDQGGRPLAWCAYEPSDEPGIEIKCVDSCERPEYWEHDLYLVVHEVRVFLIAGHRAVAYVYDSMLDLLAAEGWTRTRADHDELGRHWTRAIHAGSTGGPGA